MNMMMGKMPVSVYATLSNVTNEEVDDGFTATFKFDNDLVFTVEVGTSNFINLPRWYVEGLNGTAVIDDFQVNGKIVIATADEEHDAVPIVTAQASRRPWRRERRKRSASFRCRESTATFTIIIATSQQLSTAKQSRSSRTTSSAS